jgi:hypothetical protein
MSIGHRTSGKKSPIIGDIYIDSFNNIDNKEEKQRESVDNAKKQKTEIDYDLCVSAINNFLDYRYLDRDLTDDESWNITCDCVNAFAKIAEMCFKYGKFKDKWEYEHFRSHIYDTELIIKSLKTNCEYNIGLDRDGIYLSTDLRHKDNLRYMSDDFWKLLLNLSELKGFVYEEHEFVRNERRKEFPELFSTNKSVIYRILRKYIFDATETDFQYTSWSVGKFRILCLFDKYFNDMVNEFCVAFKIMYQLNYLLWKVSDLKTKNKLR